MIHSQKLLGSDGKIINILHANQVLHFKKRENSAEGTWNRGVYGVLHLLPTVELTDPTYTTGGSELTYSQI